MSTLMMTATFPDPTEDPDQDIPALLECLTTCIRSTLRPTPVISYDRITGAITATPQQHSFLPDDIAEGNYHLLFKVTDQDALQVTAVGYSTLPNNPGPINNSWSLENYGPYYANCKLLIESVIESTVIKRYEELGAAKQFQDNSRRTYYRMLSERQTSVPDLQELIIQVHRAPDVSGSQRADTASHYSSMGSGAATATSGQYPASSRSGPGTGTSNVYATSNPSSGNSNNRAPRCRNSFVFTPIAPDLGSSVTDYPGVWADPSSTGHTNVGNFDIYCYGRTENVDHAGDKTAIYTLLDPPTLCSPSKAPTTISCHSEAKLSSHPNTKRHPLLTSSYPAIHDEPTNSQQQSAIDT
ncbi:hypothetical protein HD553DRAFT_322617 [Filobasidium floriforme]|uniref:uncharacterized protein n=1 Tax=Filobasidium floriforme TaxID=5210 RepID=UPI001E8E95BD|nr:uncharacterized protein HD553DRAFT_322617 [Filobasidium floriforme]KAH8088116.1 hypothetical protein HD553DRAFT_322617 [Filobasidium floriforme]